MKKIIITSILFLGLTLSGFSQSKKLMDKAQGFVDKLNAEITAVDKSLALTDEQKSQILDIQVDRLKALRDAKKEGASKEENKEINKSHFQKIYKEILTKEQKKARQKGKQKTNN